MKNYPFLAIILIVLSFFIWFNNVNAIQNGIEVVSDSLEYLSPTYSNRNYSVINIASNLQKAI